MSSSKSLCEAIRTTVDSSFLLNLLVLYFFNYTWFFGPKKFWPLPTPPNTTPAPQRIWNIQDTRWQQSMPWVFRVDPRSPNHITWWNSALPSFPTHQAASPKLTYSPSVFEPNLKFETNGNPQPERKKTQMKRTSSKLPIFWGKWTHGPHKAVHPSPSILIVWSTVCHLQCDPAIPSSSTFWVLFLLGNV